MNFWMGKAQSKNVSAYDGAIFLCNHLTRKECFHRKIFGLSSKCTDFIQRVKAGATLFLYDVDQHKLHGVFEATSDGAMNIIPDAYASTGFQYPCQVRFKRIWFCKPLMECEFEDAVQDNYFSRNKFSYGLSHQQVVKLLHLFSSRNRLQPRQNPRLQDEPPRESEISSVISQTDNQSGSNSSSHGSLKSPCQTCTSSTVGEDAASPSNKLAKPHGELQLDISDVAKSNSSRSSLHTAANTDIVTDSSTQEAMDDKSTDDYIPLQLEEDTIDGVDYLSDLLGDESYSSESKGSSDSEEHTTFHQPCGRKKDYCHQPMENSKLRADIEGRKSVFARLIGRPKSFSQKEKSKTKPFTSRNAKSFSSLSRSKRKNRRRAQQNKPFPGDKRATFDMPWADKMGRIPALNHSFVWDDDRRSNKFTGEKPSTIQTGQHPYLREGANEWDVSTKEPDRYDASEKLFVPDGSTKFTESCDRELKKPPLFAEVHESCEVSVREEIRTPFSDFKRRSKDPDVEGGDQDFETEDVEEAARKKTRLASASFQREEYQSETALIQDTKPIDILTISDGDCKLQSITLSSNDTSTQMARAYLESEMLQDEQKMIQGCCEDVTGDKCMILGDIGNMPNLSFSNKQTSLNVEASSEVASGHLETETSLQEKQNQSDGSCYGVANTDIMLLLENPETMDISTNNDEDCGSKMCLPSDGNTRHVASDHLVTEMPTQEKQTPNVQSDSQAVRCDEVLVPENSEEMFPKFDANCERSKSLSSDEAYNHVEASHQDTPLSLQEKPSQSAPGCCKIVNAGQEFCQENSVTLETSPKYDRHPVKNSLSSDGNGGYVASDLYSSDASPYLDSPEPLSNLPKCHGDGANKNILPDVTLEMAATDHQETCKLPQNEPFRSLSGDNSSVLEYSGTVDTSTADGDSDKLLTPEDCGNVDLLPKLSFGNMLTVVETRSEVDFSHVETETCLQEKQNQSGRSCYGVVNTDTMLHLENPETMVLSPNHDDDVILQMSAASDHQETFTLPQGKHSRDFCGDTSSVLEHSGTVDTSTADGDSENMAPSYQKDAEVTYSPTRSEEHEDTTNTMSLNRRRSSSPPCDQELSKAVSQLETQHEAAHHENSDSTDPFAVYGSESGIPAGSTSTHLVVADLLGTSSESRTGFFDGLLSDITEMMMFGHDPGEEMEPH